MKISVKVVVFLMFVGSPLLGQFNRTAVSVNGLDTNLCTTTDPCRSFAAALNQTNAGGEVIALDSGGYGPFTLDKPATVQAAPGVYAGITTSSGQGVDVILGNFEAATLRGLSIKAIPGGSAVHGIRFSTGGSLLVDNCFILDATHGISQTGASSRVTVLDTKFVGVADGVHVETTSTAAAARATIDGCRFVRNANFAVSGTGNARITASNSVIHQSFVAFTAHNAGTQGGVEMNIDNCVAAHGSTGMYVSGTGLTMRVTDSISVNHSNIGFGQGSGAVFETRGNNMVRGNAINISGTLTGIGGN